MIKLRQEKDREDEEKAKEERRKVISERMLLKEKLKAQDMITSNSVDGGGDENGTRNMKRDPPLFLQKDIEFQEK